MASKETNIFNQTEVLLEEFKDRAKFMDRRVDKGFVNDQTGASVGIRENGDTVIAASDNAQYKQNAAQGSTTEISLQSNTITNRKHLVADELLINEHKMNPQLVELADMRQMHGDPDKAIGNLTMMGTVLVKAWEPNLGKYVLIRRQVRVPVFSPALNLPNAPEELSINVGIGEELLDLSKGE